ncbi:hypothetical protein AALP_AAs41881U000600 [Arabis alpina]|uniref:Uncharacterized protein n=1 Tax=Arabis alpina TaxID=50452 RepID=A0A087G108_ARAAL|nr:hypothetical protein AALP_AAs41881U000600 [Arabis alpina]
MIHGQCSSRGNGNVAGPFSLYSSLPAFSSPSSRLESPRNAKNSKFVQQHRL